MRVLHVNKFFHPRAGAETSFLQTRRLLLERGHEVLDFAMRHPENLHSPYEAHFAPFRSYDGTGGIARRGHDAVASVYSVSARRCLAGLLEERAPDVAHLHNVYHQLSLSVVDELRARGVPIVMTLHDWKVACPAYTLYTEGAPCRRCPRGSVVNSIRHRCVKDSAAASTLAAAEAAVARARHTYAKIDRFIAPSRFAIEVAEMGGVPRDRVLLVPNFLPEDELAGAPSRRDRGPRIFYAGRLDPTKGLRELFLAFARLPPQVELRIAGSGELEDEVRDVARRDPRIAYLGRLSRDEVFAEYAAARAVVMPSVWEENGPLVLLEAQACGTPLIVSDRGGPREFVAHGETGLVVDPRDTESLANAMARLALDPELAARWGERARSRVLSEHNADRHYGCLLNAYSEAIAARD